MFFMTEIIHCQKCINKKDYWRSINHDCYYWLKTKEEDNYYAFSSLASKLLLKFNNKDIYNIAEKFDIYNLINECLFHSIWLHNWLYHSNYDNENQAEHVDEKNINSFLIFLKIRNKTRQLLLEEIKNFSLCPPFKNNGICGFEYKLAKKSFYEKIIQQSKK